MVCRHSSFSVWGITLLVGFHPKSPVQNLLQKNCDNQVFFPPFKKGGAGIAEGRGKIHPLTAFLTILSNQRWNVSFMSEENTIISTEPDRHISEYFHGINLNQCNVWKHFSPSNSWCSLDSIITNCNTLSSLFTKSLVRDFECVQPPPNTVRLGWQL